MNSKNSLSGLSVVAVALALVIASCVSVPVYGQDAGLDLAPGGQLSLPSDWSSKHVIYSGAFKGNSRTSAGEQASKMKNDPRLLHSWLLQGHLPMATTAHRVNSAPLVSSTSSGMVRAGSLSSSAVTASSMARQTAKKPHRDWSLSLGSGGVAQNMFPAKFNFDIGSPLSGAPGPPPTGNCLNDFVVFGLNVAGSGTQANLVGVDDLYSGTSPAGLCGSTPNVKFAYNVSTIGGRITTSPILSLDGTMVAFVESSATASVLHILKWKDSNGTVTAPVTPTTATSAATCTAPCMVNVPYGSSATTLSSPYYDYPGGDDALYVGNDNGQLFQIIGTFQGTPIVSTMNGWSSTGIAVANAAVKMTGPVLDSNSGNIFIGGSDGKLYAVQFNNPATQHSIAVGSGSANGGGIVDAPTVDGFSNTVFAYAAANAANVGGTTMAANTQAVTLQADTMTPFGTPSVATIGQGTLGSAGNAGLNELSGAFDNGYYNWSGTGANTGNFYMIGTASNATSPTLYQLPFSGVKAINLTGTGSGYTTPVVSISGDGTGATAAASGGVDSVTVSGTGGSYTAAPTVTFTGTGTGASGTVHFGVNTIGVTSGGSGYATPPPVTFSTSGTVVTSATATASLGVGSVGIISGDTYSGAMPTVLFSGGSPTTPASGQATGSVNAVTGLSGGTYPSPGTFPPTVAFTAAPSGGTTATGTSTGTVSVVAITAGGTYSGAMPTVTFSGGTPATAASATATGSVNGLSGLSGGTYTVLPGVAFDAAPAGGTTAIGTPTGSVNSVTGISGGAYTTFPPAVTFSAPGSGTTATGSATGSVSLVNTFSTSSYNGAMPNVTFATAPAGGTTATGTATGSVNGFAGLSGGTYTALPGVTFGTAPAGGTTATGSVTASVNGVTGLSGGSYTTAFPPGVTFSAPGSGTTATGSSTGSVLGIYNLSGGTYTTALPTISFTGNATATTVTATVTGVTSLTPGSGYNTPPTPTFSPSGATGTAYLGVVSYTPSGNGVWNATNATTIAVPTVTVSAPTGMGNPTATATATANFVMSTMAIGSSSGTSCTANTYTIGGGVSGTADTITVTRSSGGSHNLTGLTLNAHGRLYTSSAPPTAPTGICTGTAPNFNWGIALSTVVASVEGSGYTGSGTTVTPSTSPSSGSETVAASLGVSSVTASGGSYTSSPGVTFPGGAVNATATPTLTVTAISGISGGSGYTAAPTVTFSCGTGCTTRATASASMTVSGITISGGSGYTAPPTINFATCSTGCTTQASATGTTLTVSGLALSSSGSGYTTSPSVTFSGGTFTTAATATGATLAVSAVTLNNNGGAGYTSRASITFSAGGTCTGTCPATASTVMTVSGVTLGNAGGLGYTAPPTVTFACASGCTTGATATGTTLTVSAVALTGGSNTAGSGYTTAPGATFSGGTFTTPATATGATLAVSAISLTGGTNTGGLGYTARPTIGFSPTGATATATMAVAGVTLTGASPGGLGYTTSPSVTFGTCSGCTAATATGTTLTVTGVTVTLANAGAGYQSPPTAAPSSGSATFGTVSLTVVSVTPGTAGDYAGGLPSAVISGATLTTTAKVVAVTVTAPSGSGYTSAPSVTFTGGTGSGATATATIAVSAVNITFGGGGYTTATATITGGATNPTATVVVNPGTVMSAGTPTANYQYLIDNSAGLEPASPLSEIYNGVVDRVFYSFGTSSICLVYSQDVTNGVISTSPASINEPSPAPGTSGIVVDNISSQAQASSIYFGTLGQVVSGTGQKTVNIASVTSNFTFFSANTVTVTTQTAHGFSAGNSVVVAGVTGGSPTYNGTFSILTVTSTTFTYTNCSTICAGVSANNNTGTATSTAPTTSYQAVKLTQSALN